MNRKAFAPNAWTGDNLIGWCPKAALAKQITGQCNITSSGASESPEQKIGGDAARQIWLQRLSRAVDDRVARENEAIRNKVIDSRYKVVSSKQPKNAHDIIGQNYHRGMRN